MCFRAYYFLFWTFTIFQGTSLAERNQDNPVQEGTKLRLTADSDNPWSVCNWYYNEAPDPACVQYSAGLYEGNFVQCDPSRSSSARNDGLSGGSYEERKCHLEMLKYDSTDDGTWRALLFMVSGPTLQNATFVTFASRKSAVALLFGGDDDDVSGDDIDVLVDEDFSVECKARSGLPDPADFSWLMDGQSDFLQDQSYDVRMSEMTRSTDDLEHDYPQVVSQTLTMKTNELRNFRLTCKANQVGTNYRPAEADVKVRVRLADDQLEPYWIVLIVVLILMLLVLLGFVLFLFKTRKFCFSRWGDEDVNEKVDGTRPKKEDKKSRKQKQAEAEMTQRDLIRRRLEREIAEEKAKQNRYVVGQDYHQQEQWPDGPAEISLTPTIPEPQFPDNSQSPPGQQTQYIYGVVQKQPTNNLANGHNHKPEVVISPPPEAATLPVTSNPAVFRPASQYFQTSNPSDIYSVSSTHDSSLYRSPMSKSPANSLQIGRVDETRTMRDRALGDEGLGSLV